MRSNSGSGKGKNNHRDPTMKEHEGDNRKPAGSPPPGRPDTDTDPARGGTAPR
jgi:hypothetical protein